MLIDIAKQQLRKAGWYEERKIDLTKFEEEYAKIGSELFPAARKFLEEFGDLAICDKVEFPYTKDGVSYNESSTQWSICAGRRDLELEKRVSKGKIWAAVLGEVIGTGLIGSVLSYPVMTYLWGRTGLTWMFYVPSFLMGTIIGGSIAYVLLKSMSRSGILENIQRKLGVQKFVETNE